MINLNVRSSPFDTPGTAPIDELSPREVTPEPEALGAPPAPLDAFARATGSGSGPASLEPVTAVASDPELVQGVAATRREISYGSQAMTLSGWRTSSNQEPVPSCSNDLVSWTSGRAYHFSDCYNLNGMTAWYWASAAPRRFTAPARQERLARARDGREPR